MSRGLRASRNGLSVIIFDGKLAGYYSPMLDQRIPSSVTSFVLLVLVLAGSTLGWAAERTNSVPAVPRPNVLLITVDTLRPDHLGCYGYEHIQTPSIDSLAAEGIRFTQAYTPIPITLPSHSVMLTGTYPM